MGTACQPRSRTAPGRPSPQVPLPARHNRRSRQIATARPQPAEQAQASATRLHGHRLRAQGPAEHVLDRHGGHRRTTARPQPAGQAQAPATRTLGARARRSNTRPSQPPGPREMSWPPPPPNLPQPSAGAGQRVSRPPPWTGLRGSCKRWPGSSGGGQAATSGGVWFRSPRVASRRRRCGGGVTFRFLLVFDPVTAVGGGMARCYWLIVELLF